MITLTAGWIFKWLAPTPLPRLTWQHRLGPGSQTHTTHLAQLMRWGSSRCLQCPRAGGSVTLGTTLVTLAGSTHVTPPRPGQAPPPPTPRPVSIYWRSVVLINSREFPSAAWLLLVAGSSEYSHLYPRPSSPGRQLATAVLIKRQIAEIQAERERESTLRGGAGIRLSKKGLVYRCCITTSHGWAAPRRAHSPSQQAAQARGE